MRRLTAEVHHCTYQWYASIHQLIAQTLHPGQDSFQLEVPVPHHCGL